MDALDRLIDFEGRLYFLSCMIHSQDLSKLSSELGKIVQEMVEKENKTYKLAEYDL